MNDTEKEGQRLGVAKQLTYGAEETAVVVPLSLELAAMAPPVPWWMAVDERETRAE